MNEEMMRERYESLPLSELRAVAKARGLKGISALRESTEKNLIEIRENNDRSLNRIREDNDKKHIT